MTRAADARRSLYIHVPFCASKCAYCNFHSGPPDDPEAFSRALLAELELARPLLGDGPLPSVYVGGGTPSLLPAPVIAALCRALGERVGAETEFTWECNPEDVDAGLLALLADGGVNRLSLGVQSLADDELRLAGRRHDAATARRALALACAGPFSVSADLIIGLPGLPGRTAAGFDATLDGVLAHPIDHLSVYCLELDEPVPMADLLAERPELDPGETCRAETYLATHERLAAAGFAAYEVSNWCRPGKACRHNAAIWEGGEYVGLGPAAHSFAAGRRWSQAPDLAAWRGALLAGEAPPRREDERGADAMRLERLLLALRTRRGLPADDPLLAGRDDLLRDCVRAGWAETAAGRFRLTPSGWLRLDGILARLTT